MVKRKRSQRGLTKVEAIGAVVTLVVVVASVVMLKGKFVFDEADDAQTVESTTASTPADASPPTAGLPFGTLYFTRGSARLPVRAEDTLAPLVSALRADPTLGVTVSASAPGDDHRLAQARLAAIRHAFEADGVSSRLVDTRVVRGDGAASASEAVSLRVQAR